MRYWDELSGDQRRALVRQLEKIDFGALHRLWLAARAEEALSVDPGCVRGVDVARLPRTDAERGAWRRAGEVGAELIAAGKVAVVIVAGGQGTRLGFDGPKGTYPIAPVTGKSLFQLHAEKIAALSRRFGGTIPVYVMTSPENHAATVGFFREHDRFGLKRVRFFVQGQMPVVDAETGRVLLAEKGGIALAPDGHGGALDALNRRGPDDALSCLEEMHELGIETVYYFQVDNALVKIAEPAFLGLHREAGAEVSFKVVEKATPYEKVGVVVEVDGVPRVIEYSDLGPELAELREADGSLSLWAGSIAVHVFELAFLERLISEARLPYHRALKKAAYIDETGARIEPDSPNAIKFERFIFDTLPFAARFAVVETDRATEFEPLKNATGPDSPESVRRRLSEMYAEWLDAAGAKVARGTDGAVPFGIEISPLFALDCAELKSKISPGLIVDQALYLGEASGDVVARG